MQGVSSSSMRRCLWREDGDAAREIQGLTSGRETEV